MARFCVLPRAFRGKRVDGKKTRPISGVAGTWPKKEYKTRFSTAVSHNSSFSSALRSAFFLSASYSTTMMSLRLALLALVAVSARSALGDSSRNLQAAAAAAAASGGGPFGGGSSTSTAAVGGGNPFFWGRRLQAPERNRGRRSGSGGRGGGASTSTSTSTSKNAAAGAAAAASGNSVSTSVVGVVGRKLQAPRRNAGTNANTNTNTNFNLNNNDNDNSNGGRYGGRRRRGGSSSSTTATTSTSISGKTAVGTASSSATGAPE